MNLPPVNTNDWVECRNEIVGYSFKHPKGWFYSYMTPQEGLYVYDDCNYKKIRVTELEPGYGGTPMGDSVYISSFSETKYKDVYGLMKNYTLDKHWVSSIDGSDAVFHLFKNTENKNEYGFTVIKNNERLQFRVSAENLKLAEAIISTFKFLDE